MDLDILNQRVTRAIIRAEGLEATGSVAARDEAYLVVSFCEEEIAEHLPAASEEGAIARRGAVSAALTAGLPARARELALRYSSDTNAPDELVRELRALQAEAEAELDVPALQATVVIPTARCRLHDVAA